MKTSHKNCTTCAKDWPRTHFQYSQTSDDGRGNHCRRCRVARRNESLEPKRCHSCGIDKSLADFNRDKSRADGRCEICRTCKRNRLSGYAPDPRWRVHPVLVSFLQGRVPAATFSAGPSRCSEVA